MITKRQFVFAAGAGLLGGILGTGSSAGAANEWSEDLVRDILRIESALRARVGVAVLDTETGRRASHRGGERFPLCSTFKFLAAAAVLKRVDAGEEDPSRLIPFGVDEVVPYSPVTKGRAGSRGMTLAELCEAAMTLSDNTAGNLTLKSIGGPKGLTAFARSLGDGTTRLDRWEPDLNEGQPGDPRDTTSPEAMAADMHALLVEDALSPRSRDQLASWLVSNKTGDARLRAAFPKDWRIGDKTGTGHHGTANDVAIVWPPGRKPLIVSVYVTETKASFKARNEAIAEVGRAVRSALRI